MRIPLSSLVSAAFLLLVARSAFARPPLEGTSDLEMALLFDIAGTHYGALGVMVDYSVYVHSVSKAVRDLIRADIDGADVWPLYKDVCNEGMRCFATMVSARNSGIVSKEAMRHAMDNRGAGIDFQAVNDQVLRRQRE